jgi:hypothetical protein
VCRAGFGRPVVPEVKRTRAPRRDGSSRSPAATGGEGAGGAEEGAGGDGARRGSSPPPPLPPPPPPPRWSAAHGRHAGAPPGSNPPLASLVSAASSARARTRASKEGAAPPPPPPPELPGGGGGGWRIAEAPTSASDAAIALAGSSWCSGTAHPPAAQTPQSAAAKPGDGRPRTATRGPAALAPVAGSTFLLPSSKSTRDLRAAAVARAVASRPEKVVTRPVRESTRAGAEGPCARESAAASVGRRRGRGGRDENDVDDENGAPLFQSASRLAAAPA